MSASKGADPLYRLRGEVGEVVRSYPIAPGENRIGSVGENTIVLPVRGVSRQHARLLFDGEGLVLEDLGSRNGTVVNGVRIQRTRLEAGDEVRLGPVELHVEAVAADDQRLAIAVDAATPAAPGGLSPAEATATRDGVAGQLALVEAFLARLSVRPDPDLAGALGLLRRDLGAHGVCLFELAGGDPLVLAAAGEMDESALRRGARTPAASSQDASSTAVLEGDPAVARAFLGERGGHRIGLAAWGASRGRGLETERLLRVLLTVADRFRPHPLHAPDAAASGERELRFPEGFVPGDSPAMRSLYAQMRPLVQGDLPVLILGETGVGKEGLAHILHASSARRRGPFVAINCAAIPADLLEAEMFGIGKGIATGVVERPGKFQLAEKGTLLLDEIGDMPLALQSKLLRALQEKEVQPVGGAPVAVDIRVVAATNSDLHRRMDEGGFRRDLYYRVAGFALRVPPLRERREDVPALVEHFLRAFAREAGKSVRGITVRALSALVDYGWPGNIRELEHEVRRLVYLCPEGHAIESTMLSASLLAPHETAPEPEAAADLGLERRVGQLERRLIEEALRRASGNRTQAAKLLGVSRNGLAIKMQRLGIAATGE